MIKSTVLSKTLFTVSGTAMTVLFTTKVSFPLFALGTVCSFAIFYWLAFKLNFLEKTLADTSKVQIVFALVLAVLANYQFTVRFASFTNSALNKLSPHVGLSQFQWLLNLSLPIALGIASLFASFVFYLLILKMICIPVKESFNVSRKQLLFIILWGVVASICIAVLFNYTSAFSFPTMADGTRNNNALFGSDGYAYSGYRHFFNGDSFRHPLFSVIFMPVLSFLVFLSWIFSMVISANEQVIFSLLYSEFQIFVVIVTMLILYNLMKTFAKRDICFMSIVVLMCTFPVLLFSVLIERFAFENFLLITFIYYIVKTEDEFNTRLAFALSTFSVISAAIAFPIIILKNKSLRKSFNYLLKTIVFVLYAMMALGGTKLISTGLSDAQNNLRSYAKNNPERGFDSNFKQFLSFESGMFVAPNWQVINRTDDYPPHAILKYDTTEFPQGGIAQVYKQSQHYYILGMLVVALCALGFILNAKSLFMQSCFYWCVVCFCFLALLGVGSSLNEMYLYAYHFSWAQVLLVVMFVDKILPKKPLKIAILSGVAALIFSANVYTLINMATQLSIGFPKISCVN